MSVIADNLIGAMLQIDKAIYNAISAVYDLLISIAETEIFSNESISNFSTRVYALLGIFVSDITDDESKIHLFLGACLNADFPFSIISQKSFRSSHSGKTPPIPTIAIL